MAQHRGRQKQLEKKKKARIAKRKSEARSQIATPKSQAALIALAAKYPFGPAYLSSDWDDPAQPALVTALVTRVLPDGRYILASALVDRTCLGVKDGWVTPPINSLDLNDRVKLFYRTYPEGGYEVALKTVQSVVFHGLEYAAGLGFRPHRDFAVELFGPRPEVLEDTPWANEPRPIYASGPYDDPLVVCAQLDRSVGKGNYDLLLIVPPSDVFEDVDQGEPLDGVDDEDDPEGDDDPDVIDAPKE